MIRNNYNFSYNMIFKKAYAIYSLNTLIYYYKK